MSVSRPPQRPATAGTSAPRGAQRRVHDRVQVNMSAEVQLPTGVFTSATRDLSLGGAGLDCDRPLAEGEQIVLGLFLVVDEVEDDRTPPLWIKARVVWCAESDEGRHTAGVRFEVITDDQKAWLEKILAHIQTKEPVNR